MSQLVGKLYGTAFQVLDRQTGALQEITEPQTSITSAFFTISADDAEDGKEDEETKKASKPVASASTLDNRNLVDDNTAQKMTLEEIETLKAQNAGGAEIINALIENSESFKQRTNFSKQKYLLKK